MMTGSLFGLMIGRCDLRQTMVTGSALPHAHLGEEPVSALATRCTLGLLLLAAALGLAACTGAPGADGRYATHDRGQNNRGSP